MAFEIDSSRSHSCFSTSWLQAIQRGMPYRYIKCIIIKNSEAIPWNSSKDLALRIRLNGFFHIKRDVTCCPRQFKCLLFSSKCILELFYPSQWCLAWFRSSQLAQLCGAFIYVYKMSASKWGRIVHEGEGYTWHCSPLSPTQLTSSGMTWPWWRQAAYVAITWSPKQRWSVLPTCKTKKTFQRRC